VQLRKYPEAGDAPGWNKFIAAIAKAEGTGTTKLTPKQERRTLFMDGIGGEVWD
jgi:hypothetical protein